MEAIQLLTTDDLEYFKEYPDFIEEIRQSERELNKIYQHLLRGDCTFVSKNKEFRREAFVHNSSVEGEYKRITTFDQFGPIGHHVRPDLKEIALEIQKSGYEPINSTELKFIN